MPGTTTCDGLRKSMTSAAPSSQNRHESVSNRTISRPAPHTAPATSNPVNMRHMYPKYNSVLR